MQRMLIVSAAMLVLSLSIASAVAEEAGAVAAPTLAEGAHPFAAPVEAAVGLRFAGLDGPGRSLGWGREEPEPQGILGIEEKPEGPRSLRNALLLSAALPGLGQRYLGAPRRGWVFLGAEAAIVGTWTTFKTQEWLRRRNYQEMAEVYAGVSGDHDDDYWKVVGQFPDWLDYNEWLRFQARREFGFGTSAYYDFISEKEIAEADAWDWNNEDRRRRYAEKRKASLNAERRATYTLYAFLVNRVIAVVDTWRLYRTRQEIHERIDGQGALGLSALPGERGVDWRLGWYRSF